MIPQYATGKRVYANEKDHPAYKIFNWLFQIFVPQAFTVDLEQASRFGTPTTGDRQYDAELANEFTRVMWPISTMAVKSNDGCVIRLAKLEDAQKIHALVMEYLECWADEIELELNYLTKDEVAGNERFQKREADMLILEQFADVIYPVARSNMPKALRSNSLGDRLRALGSRINVNRDLATQEPVAAIDAPTALSINANGRSSRGAKRWL